MKPPSEAKIRKALKAHAAAHPPAPAGTRRIESNRAALSGLLGERMAKAGLDLAESKKAQKILKADKAALAETLAAREKEALAGAGAAQVRLTRGARTFTDGLQASGILSATAKPTYALLDRPVFAILSDNAQDVDWGSLPLESFVKFRFIGGGLGTVDFIYLWTNPVDRFALVNLDALVIANGFCAVFTDGHLLPIGDHRASLQVRTKLVPLPLAADPPIPPSMPASAQQLLAALSLNTGGDWASVGEIDARELADAFLLYHNYVIVPPQASVVIKVSIEISADVGQDSGSADANFTTGDFKVMSPYVLVTVLS